MEVLNSAPRRVMRIELAKTGGDFDDFSNSADLRDFDPSDRKLVAAAAKANAVVANAVDGDWLDHRRA
ncbi:MAG: hypothetical protein ACLPSW_14545 [Roseiarcus sp.]